MLDDLISAYGDRFLVAALGVSLALLCLFIVLWILRNRAPSPFVRGGRNRQPRLQVLDAAAIDTRRRIVLIRRDNIEHLVMIGGPTDLVIESGIGDERPYLSARPVNLQAPEEQSELPSPAVAPALASTDAAAPRIASPAATMSTATEPAVRHQPAAEPVKPEPVVAQTRPQPASAPVVEQRPAEQRSQPVQPRGPEPALERQPVTPPTPVLTAAFAAAPAAVAAPGLAVEKRPTEPAQTPTIEVVQRPAPPMEKPMAPDVALVQPTASVEPVMAVSNAGPSDAVVTPVVLEPELTEAAPAIEPPAKADTLATETFRMEPVEPVMAPEMVEPAREAERTVVSVQHTAPTLPPVIDAPAAEDLLEAARLRVLAPAPSAAQASPFEAKRFEPVADRRRVASEPEAPSRDLSDFERVLEEEMAFHLAADPAPAPKPAAEFSQILPETRADRPRLPASAILPANSQSDAVAPNSDKQGQEPNLQTEIARIFGEMSASRNP
ncbi:MAG: hypothetical protein ACT6RF_15815 [Allorhizobium sp.]|uniref:hypothetical protein n=1 Tax=Allorhizobium sp. TaxID=633478 RepID=UPI00403338EF